MNFTNESVSVLITELEKSGYKKYGSHFKNEDFGYWKSFHVTHDGDGDRVIGYQIALLFYDFSKYEQYNGPKLVGLQYEFVLGHNENISRCDFYISDDKITLAEFEVVAEEFYQHICKDMIFKNREEGKLIQKTNI